MLPVASEEHLQLQEEEYANITEILDVDTIIQEENLTIGEEITLEENYPIGEEEI